MAHGSRGRRDQRSGGDGARDRRRRWVARRADGLVQRRGRTAVLCSTPTSRAPRAASSRPNRGRLDSSTGSRSAVRPGSGARWPNSPAKKATPISPPGREGARSAPGRAGSRGRSRRGPPSRRRSRPASGGSEAARCRGPTTGGAIGWSRSRSSSGATARPDCTNGSSSSALVPVRHGKAPAFSVMPTLYASCSCESRRNLTKPGQAGWKPGQSRQRKRL